MIVWSTDMETGVGSIDADHKHLIDFYNLADATPADKFTKVFDDKMLSIVRSLFKSHFEKEEDLMFAINYHGTNKHMTEHSTMLAYPVNADTHYMLGAPNRRSRVQRRSAPQPRPRSPAMI